MGSCVSTPNEPVYSDWVQHKDGTKSRTLINAPPGYFSEPHLAHMRLYGGCPYAR